MVFVLLLTNGAEGRLFLSNPATMALIPFRTVRNPAGLSKHEAPPSQPLVGRVATTGSLSAALVVFTKQLALAATKAAPIPVAPAPGFWSNILSMLGAGVVSLALPLGIVLSIIAMQWQLTSAKSEALIRRFDTARQQELTRMDTERKTDMARMDTERKADMASVKAEQARMDTERKTEQARMDTERKTEQARMLTELKDTLASNVVALKAANRAAPLTSDMSVAGSCVEALAGG